MRSSLRWTLSGLALPSAAAALIILALSFASFQSLGHSARQALLAKDLVADVLPPPMYLIEMRLVLSQAVEGALDADAAQRRLDRLASEYEARADYWRREAPPALRQHLLGEQHAQALRFVALARQDVLAPLHKGDRTAAQAGLTAADAAFQAHRQAVDQTVQAGGRDAEAAMEGFDAVTRRGAWLMPLTAAGLLLVSAVLGWRIYWGLIGAVRECAAVAEAVAAGDLQRRATTRRRDELGSLVDALNGMSEHLGSIVGRVRAGSHAVARATAEIAQGNEDLSVRTETQASHLQETVASVEQMCSALADSARAACQADALAAETAQVAHRGQEAVNTLVGTMGDIQQASRRIADIVGVIDDLAFQTNLLALNAAVEAAQAGELGRGFAVVAAEVRALAQRSADAAHEIKGLIAASTTQVDAGARHADHAGRMIAAMVDQVGKVTALIGEIATTSGQQTSGFAQISTSLGEIDTATQQNSALVEQTAAAAHSLQDQAAQLADAVDQFRMAGRFD